MVVINSDYNLPLLGKTHTNKINKWPTNSQKKDARSSSSFMSASRSSVVNFVVSPTLEQQPNLLYVITYHICMYSIHPFLLTIQKCCLGLCSVIVREYFGQKCNEIVRWCGRTPPPPSFRSVITSPHSINYSSLFSLCISPIILYNNLN